MSSRPLNRVRCTRCRNEHAEEDRVSRPRPRRSTAELQLSDTVCPRCGCKSFYDLQEQVAWCWASGLIEIGDQMPKDSATGGAIEIARGPKFALKGQIAVVARHGKGASAGCFLVPGVPEAEGQEAKGDALSAFLAWCGTRKPKDGVVFAKAFP